MFDDIDKLAGKKVLYDEIVARFRSVTSLKGANGFCCARTVVGVPECCAHIGVSQELTFTEAEVRLLGWWDIVVADPHGTGMFILDKTHWTPELIGRSIHDGDLAFTLECAAHPTRPIVEFGEVIGVVAIDACNAENVPEALDVYREHRLGLTADWQAAVTLLGEKPWYVTHSIRKGWTVL